MMSDVIALLSTLLLFLSSSLLCADHVQLINVELEVIQYQFSLLGC